VIKEMEIIMDRIKINQRKKDKGKNILAKTQHFKTKNDI
jgi:hypothetical protein